MPSKRIANSICSGVIVGMSGAVMIWELVLDLNQCFEFWHLSAPLNNQEISTGASALQLGHSARMGTAERNEFSGRNGVK